MHSLICIAGKNNIAVHVAEYLRSNHPNIPLCAITNKNDDGNNSFQYSFKAYAERNGIPLLKLEDVYDNEDMIFLSLEFDSIVKPELFKTKRLFNIHFSLLPQYKGMYTSAMPILNGESKTGVTFHRIDRGIDTGEIISQREIPIAEKDNCKDLYLKYIKYGTELVISCLPDVISDTVVSHPQQSVKSSYFSKKAIDYSNLAIDFRSTAWQVRNQIRAFNHRNYQLPSVEGCAINRALITDEPSKEKPGTIISRDNDCITVATIDYNVVLIKDKLDYLFDIVKSGNLTELMSVNDIEEYINEHETSHGWTLLMVAAYAGNEEMCDYLLSKGADINATNFNGTSFIMYIKDACLKMNDPQMMYSYISRGANPFKRDAYGKHLLHYLKQQHPDWIDKILKL
jgi:methionyl-tRNA formyltransferase